MEVLQISIDGMIELGVKIRTEKHPCRISDAKFSCIVFGEPQGHETLDCFEYPKYPCFNQSTKKNSPKIFLPKISESKISNPKKYFNHSRHLRFRVPTPRGRFHMFQAKGFENVPSQDNKKRCKVS